MFCIHLKVIYGLLAQEFLESSCWGFFGIKPLHWNYHVGNINENGALS